MEPGDARGVRLAALVVVLLALLPSVGTLDAPWIAEDAALLAAARADGPWADWTRSQGGLLLPPRFWRPLVSASWALQEAWTGIEPVPLRLGNLILHALVAWLVFAAARRLGAGLGGALLAGAWIALFPEQGGTSTWIAGRTDLLCAVFLLASVVRALGSAPLASAPLAFLACATKEFGFLAPLWIALLAAGRGEDKRALLRRAGPALIAVGSALVWRWLALGTLAGGYGAELPGLAAGLAGALGGMLRSVWPSLLALAALAVAGAFARSAARRALGAALLCAVVAFVPLYPLLADGWLEPENRRLFYVAECALALAAGLAWYRSAAGKQKVLFAALAVSVLGTRAGLAWTDTHDWARAARAGEAEITRARAALAGAEASPRPVLFTSFPISRFEAYCLGFGLAQRFRAPFPATPRPVWPWRLFSARDAARERAPLVAPRADGSIWPLDDASGAPVLELRTPEGAAVERLALDERALFAAEDRSPRLAVRGPAGARLEGVLHTELGYEPVPLGELAADGTVMLSLMRLLASTNGTVSAGEVLQQAADLRAERAYIELRALDASSRPLAASRWIEVSWPPELLALSLSGR